jgi:tetratricopeptide (TPR) repeat protein
MLVNDGRLVEKDGAYVTVGEITELAVPDTLTSLIAARLDGLEAGDRSLIQDASVLGQSFTLAGLAAVSGLEPEAIETRLAGLTRREILSRDMDPRSPERDQYRFVQALIREVSYQTLAKRDRKTRHLAVARFLEGLGHDEIAGALAGQYVAAYENAAAGDEAEALATQARIALKAAADRAAALGATEQAYRFLAEALSVGEGAAKDPELTQRAGEMATAAGRYMEAEALVRNAVALYEATGNSIGAIRATAAVGSALIQAARLTEAIPILEAASQQASDSTDPAVLEVRGQLARAHMLQAAYGRSVETCDEVLPAAERAGLDGLVADILVTKGTSLLQMGRPREGLPLVQAGGALGAEVGRTNTLLRSLINRALTELDVDPVASLEASRAGLALARRHGLRGMAVNLTVNAVEAAIQCGDWDWMSAVAEAGLEEDYERAERIISLGLGVQVRSLRGDSRDELLAELPGLISGESQAERGNFADVLGYDALGRGDPAGAATAWREVDRLQFESDQVQTSRIARMSLWLRDGAALERDLEQIAASGRFGAAWHVDQMILRAGLAALQGRPADAIHQYAQAAADCRRLRLPWPEALLGIDMATVLDPSLPEVATAVAASREILTRLGAKPFLARLDDLTAGAPAAVPVSVESSAVETSVQA